MAVTYEDVTPSLIPNTTMRKFILNGVHKQYTIAAVDGYVLHDNAGSWDDLEGVTQHAYYVGTCSCAATYAFTPATITVTDNNGNPLTVTAYGSREFFAIPADNAPENNIFGGVNNPEHEVM